MSEVESLKALLMAETDHEEIKEKERKEKEKEIISIHEKALDDLVGVNSLLAVAVFIGLSLASPDSHSLENRPECDADPGLGMRLVLFEVISFGLFILSTLVAKATKVHINIHKKEKFLGTQYKYVRGLLLLLSVTASFTGVVFLTISMVDVIQIKIGKLSCGSMYAYRSVASFVGIIFVALLVYSFTAGHAIYVSMDYDFQHEAQSK